MAASPRFGGHGPLLCGLALTRIIGWGSTFYSPSVLVSGLDRDLGLNAEIVFGGITILLVTHEPDVAAFAGRQIVVRDGRIVRDERNPQPGVAREALQAFDAARAGGEGD